MITLYIEAKSPKGISPVLRRMEFQSEAGAYHTVDWSIISSSLDLRCNTWTGKAQGIRLDGNTDADGLKIDHLRGLRLKNIEIDSKNASNNKALRGFAIQSVAFIDHNRSYIVPESDLHTSLLRFA